MNIPARTLAHVERLPILWGDMDALGHVNNVTYFRYMEQARVSLFEALVPSEDRWNSHPIVIVNASCNFRKPLVYPGMIEVSVWVEPPGGASLKTLYEIRLAGDPEIYADGTAMVVFIDAKTQKAVRIPEEVRERLRAMASAAGPGTR